MSEALFGMHTGDVGKVQDVIGRNSGEGAFPSARNTV